MPVLTEFDEGDMLSDVLGTVSLRSVVFCRMELRAPWGIGVGDRDMTGFHAVIQGQATLAVRGIDPPIEVSAGDLLIFPHGSAHVMRDPPVAPVVPLQQILEHPLIDSAPVVRYGGSGQLTELLCGEFVVENRRINPLLAGLPPLIVIRGSGGTCAPWLKTTLNYVADEVGRRDLGAKAVVTRLADILFIQAIRAHFNSVAGDSAGWLGGLKDAEIAKALTVIHRRSAESWTVASLAKQVGMSRSAFAEKFKATVGEAPLQYVARWRLNLAARLLRATQAKISWVAREVGYESEVAFHRAFKRLVGVSPGDYRRKCRDQAAASHSQTMP